MTLAAFDFALRAATVALLLVLAASLYRDFGKIVAGRLAVAFALGSAVHAAISGIGSVSGVPLSHAPLIALSTSNVVVFWLFCRALFDDAFSLRWWHALIWLAVAAFSFANCLWIAPAGHVRLSIFAINLVALGFIVLAVAQTIASWSGDLVEGRRRLRIFDHHRGRALWRHQCSAADTGVGIVMPAPSPVPRTPRCWLPSSPRFRSR